MALFAGHHRPSLAPIAPGLIFHTDRGSQYGSRAQRLILEQADIVQSMSARANPYHNARTESFMGTLKNEMLQGSSFTTESNARLDIFDLIESCYSHHRKPNAPGYRPSAQFDTETHPNN